MASLVRLLAVVAAAFVAVSFLAFASVELQDSSEGQVEAINGAPASKNLETDLQRPNPEPAVERVREANHTSIRENIDDVDDVLVSPFTSFTDFQSVWGERFLILVLGLALYLGGGLMLANFFPKAKNEAGDWREATG
jgi:hypothetical protein